MSSVAELLSGVLRYFPNLMIVTLFVLGVTTGRLPFILVSIGGLMVVVATLTLQYILSDTFGLGPPTDGPGASLIEACSLLPVATGGEYSATPSLWVAASSFFATYIFMNASNVYTQTPARANKDKIGVQQRKGIGLISMLAVTILFAFILSSRMILKLSPFVWKQCETTLGVVLGLVVGVFGGWGWWKLLDACGPDYYPDIHGVMLGLKPGSLHTNPKVCAPTNKK
jgi:hypothetical protein